MKVFQTAKQRAVSYEHPPLMRPQCLWCPAGICCVCQEEIVRTGHKTMDWFKIGKGVYQGCILSLCLFNFYAEYLMWNAGLDESQAGIKIPGRNINNLRFADDTI